VIEFNFGCSAPSKIVVVNFTASVVGTKVYAAIYDKVAVSVAKVLEVPKQKGG